MTNVFTLDDLNKAIEVKYAPFVFQAGKDKFTLQQVVRLPKASRDEVKVLIEALESNQEDLAEEQMTSVLGEIIKVICADSKGDRLLEILDNDVLKMTTLFEKWVESTQAGEA